MTEGAYTPDRVRADPNAAPMMIFVTASLNFVTISEIWDVPSLFDIMVYEMRKSIEVSATMG